MAEAGIRPTGSSIGHHLAVYRRLVAAQVRSDWQYRTSFVFFCGAQAAVTALEFATLVILFGVVPDLGGWSASQVALLYGLSSLPFGVTDALVSPIETVSSHVREGSFDRLLLRPLSAMVQLFATEFELRRFGKSIAPAAVLVWALAVAPVDWDLATVGLVVVALVSGTVIYTALWILTASVAFWVVAAQEATNSFTYGGEFANSYPLHLYPGWVRAIMGWIVPLAFVAYVPAQRILDAPNPLGLPAWLWVTSPLVALVTLAVALGVWSVGVRRYQGTGS